MSTASTLRYALVIPFVNRKEGVVGARVGAPGLDCPVTDRQTIGSYERLYGAPDYLESLKGLQVVTTDALIERVGDRLLEKFETNAYVRGRDGQTMEFFYRLGDRGETVAARVAATVTEELIRDFFEVNVKFPEVIS